MKTYTINPKTTALLIIDAQREYFDADKPLFTPNAAKIRDNLIKLKAYAEEKSIPTVIIEHMHRADGGDVGRMGDFDPTPVFTEGTDGCETIAELSSPKDIHVRKTRYSAFVNTKLESLLKSWGVDTVIITGLMTNFCSVTTARHAHDLDYKVIFVIDANAGPDMPDVGYGAIPHGDIMKVIATTLACGVADIATTSEIISQRKS
jgi:ureidoacrylate peracid hydrolase